MIVLDTNVLSELMRPEPSERVLYWLGEIAAIATVHEAPVATRNVSDFDGCGIGVIDPWRD